MEHPCRKAAASKRESMLIAIVRLMTPYVGAGWKHGYPNSDEPECA